jgi:hypothetical protein
MDLNTGRLSQGLVLLHTIDPQRDEPRESAQRRSIHRPLWVRRSEGVGGTLPRNAEFSGSSCRFGRAWQVLGVLKVLLWLRDDVGVTSSADLANRDSARGTHERPRPAFPLFFLSWR